MSYKIAKTHWTQQYIWLIDKKYAVAILYFYPNTNDYIGIYYVDLIQYVIRVNI